MTFKCLGELITKKLGKWSEILPSIPFQISNKVINRWNSLNQRTADAPSINAFKSRLVVYQGRPGELFHRLVC